jgi:hypothetical protein
MCPRLRVPGRPAVRQRKNLLTYSQSNVPRDKLTPLLLAPHTTTDGIPSRCCILRHQAASTTNQRATSDKSRGTAMWHGRGHGQRIHHWCGCDRHRDDLRLVVHDNWCAWDGHRNRHHGDRDRRMCWSSGHRFARGDTVPTSSCGNGTLRVIWDRRRRHPCALRAAAPSRAVERA